MMVGADQCNTLAFPGGYAIESIPMSPIITSCRAWREALASDRRTVPPGATCSGGAR